MLEKVLAGEFDAKALAKRLAQIHKLETALSAAEEKEDWDGMITQLDALIELETEDLDYHHKRKYKILLQSKRDFPAAFAFGNTLLKHFEHYPGILHHLARVTVDDADATQDLRDLALKMGQQIAADGHPIFLSTLAHVQWKRGENEDAIKTVQKAIDRSGGGLAAALQKNLDEYQKAKGQ